MTMLKSAGTAAIALLLCAVGANAANHKGDTSLGPKVGYSSKNKSVLAGLVFQHSFSDHFRLSPEISYSFRANDLDAFIIDVNAHVPFAFQGGKAGFYPLAGFTFNSWNMHTPPMPDNDVDVSTHANRWGLNFGAGLELRCTESLKLTVEGRYCLVKDYGNAQVTAGIAYVF